MGELRSKDWLALAFALELGHVLVQALATYDWERDSVCELLVAPALWMSYRLAREGRPGLALGSATVSSSVWWSCGLPLAQRGWCGTHVCALAMMFAWIPALNLLLASLSVGTLVLGALHKARAPAVPITAVSLPLAQGAYVTAFALALPAVAPLPILTLVPALFGLALLARAGRPALSEALAAIATVVWWCVVLPEAPRWVYAQKSYLFSLAIFGWVPLLSVLRALGYAARSVAEPPPRYMLVAKRARLQRVGQVARKAFAWELGFVMLLGLVDKHGGLVVHMAAPVLWLSRKLIAERRHLLGLVCGWGLLSLWWGFGLCAIPPHGCMMSDAPLQCFWLPALNALLLGAGLVSVLPLALQAAWESARQV